MCSERLVLEISFVLAKNLERPAGVIGFPPAALSLIGVLIVERLALILLVVIISIVAVFAVVEFVLLFLEIVVEIVVEILFVEIIKVFVHIALRKGLDDDRPAPTSSSIAGVLLIVMPTTSNLPVTIRRALGSEAV